MLLLLLLFSFLLLRLFMIVFIVLTFFVFVTSFSFLSSTWSAPTLATMRAPRPRPGFSWRASWQPAPAAHSVQTHAFLRHVPPASVASTVLLRWPPARGWS
jgi:hypothetical protein